MVTTTTHKPPMTPTRKAALALAPGVTEVLLKSPDAEPQSLQIVRARPGCLPGGGFEALDGTLTAGSLPTVAGHDIPCPNPSSDRRPGVPDLPVRDAREAAL